MRIIKLKKLLKGKVRYVIVDDAGKVIDDAHGYGFKTIEKARNSTTYNNWKNGIISKKKKRRNKARPKLNRKRKISCATPETLITVVRSDSLSTPKEDRYVIIDRFKRQIVDNGQGYGYKSKVAAYSAWKWIKRRVRGEI